MRTYKVICANCNKSFIGGHPKAKYCSDKCRNDIAKTKDYYKRALKNNLPSYRKCLVCGRKFKPNKPNRIYCSRDCQYVKKREYSNDYHGKRFKILLRDNFTCQYCGRNFLDDGIKLQIDHIKPKSKGGENTQDNLITSCEECNLGKKDILLDKIYLNKLKEKVCNVKGVQSTR